MNPVFVETGLLDNFYAKYLHLQCHTYLQAPLLKHTTTIMSPTLLIYTQGLSIFTANTPPHLFFSTTYFVQLPIFELFLLKMDETACHRAMKKTGLQGII